MRRRTSMLVALAAFVATVFLALTVVAPARGDEYQYTVRVFPGNRGTLSEDPVSVTVPKGTDVNLYDIATATITDSKYIQTGFRRSGSDTVLGDGVVKGVSEDMDFVVAYGVEASMVPYTLKFVEYETGKELAEPKTYYGSDGDKPVAAYENIDGYRPLYLAITGTLHAGEENVWTFEYIPLEEGETVVVTTTNTNTTVTTVPGPTTTTTTTTTTPSEGGTTTTTGTGTTGTTSTTEGTGTTAGTTEGATAEGAAGTEGTPEGEAAQPQTQEILDLDTPLAGPEAAQAASKRDNESGSLLLNPVVLSGVAIGAIVAVGAVLILAKRKKGEEKNEEA